MCIFWFEDEDEGKEELYTNPFEINPYHLELIVSGQVDFIVCPACDGVGYRGDNICSHCLGNKILIIPSNEEEI
ncbi:MAG: hypothetical protein N2327_00435 [Caldimicrobium sp.]|nr:hypothetical protein [Caldimicrobium sp.]MCX7872893.1 hypothetical protein [Caldimicrobium sp.]